LLPRHPEVLLRFAPLICVTVLLAAGAALWAGVAPQSWGVGRNATMVNALVCLELALAPLILPVRAGRTRENLGLNFATCLACWAAAGATVLLFGFATPQSVGLETRLLSLCAWFCAGGVLAAGAALSPAGAWRARPLLIAAFALPILFHYLSLEYASDSADLLAEFSPHWLLWRGALGPAWWLAGIGAVGWLAAGGLCVRKRGQA
jgi:hypothetical protein